MGRPTRTRKRRSGTCRWPTSQTPQVGGERHVDAEADRGAQLPFLPERIITSRYLDVGAILPFGQGQRCLVGFDTQPASNPISNAMQRTNVLPALFGRDSIGPSP